MMTSRKIISLSYDAGLRYASLFYGPQGVVVTFFRLEPDGHRSAEYIYHSQTLGM